MSLISRREPVIALDDFRYRGRPYQEGSYLDRRRCRMPQSKLNRMLRAKKVVMARDLTSDQLKKYGWVYDPKPPRTKLQKIKEPITVKNQRIIDELINEGSEPKEKEVLGTTTPKTLIEDPVPPKKTKYHIHDRGNKWFDVMEGEKFIKKRVRNKTAVELLKKLEGGKNE